MALMAHLAKHIGARSLSESTSLKHLNVDWPSFCYDLCICMFSRVQVRIMLRARKNSKIVQLHFMLIGVNRGRVAAAWKKAHVSRAMSTI